MNAYQENKFSMYLLVQKVGNENINKWSGLPAFATAFKELETKIEGIKALMEIQQTAVTGVSKDKNELRDVMISKAMKISKSIIAYAENENNRTLQDKVSFSPSDLKYERDTIAAQNCQLMLSEATIILTELADYGIEQADLDALEDAITNFNTSIPTPRQAIRNRSDATIQLAKLMAEADVILTKKLDMLLEHFKDDEVKFYEAFKGARKIVNSGKRDTRLEGILRDKLTGEVLANALVELRTMDDEVVEVTETDYSGKFVFEHLKSGKYKVFVDKDGYVIEGIEKPDIRRGVINRIEMDVDRIEEEGSNDGIE